MRSVCVSGAKAFRVPKRTMRHGATAICSNNVQLVRLGTECQDYASRSAGYIS
ncbi:hypothetical protein PGB90_007842 [Kerria lacca]